MHFLCICVLILLASKTSLSINPEVILQWTNESCIGGERGLLSTGVWITLNVSGMSSGQTGVVRCSTHRQMMEYNSSLYIPNLDSRFAGCSMVSNITFEFEQPEHGGGLCHCLGIEFISPTETFR